MAKDNEKKSKRSFDLSKGTKRSFDLEKKPTRSFDLSKGSDEPIAPAPSPVMPAPTSAAPVPQGPQHPSPQPPKPSPKPAAPTNVPPTANELADNGGDGGSKKMWLWIVLAIIVLAVLAYFFIPRGKTETSPIPQTVVSDSDSTAIAPEDSLRTDSTSMPVETEPAQPQNTEIEDGSAPTTSEQSSAPQPEASEANTSLPQTSAAPSGSVEEMAQQVIQGTYGNNPERRQRLGADYKQIQRRVNQLMRQQR